jgi:hypothetical protein
VSPSADKKTKTPSTQKDSKSSSTTTPSSFVPSYASSQTQPSAFQSASPATVPQANGKQAPSPAAFLLSGDSNKENKQNPNQFKKLTQNLIEGENEQDRQTIAEFKPLVPSISAFTQLARKNSNIKPVSGASNMPSERVGDWVCLSCNNVNYQFRKECNLCSLLRADIGKTISTKEELERVSQNKGNLASNNSTQTFNVDQDFQYQGFNKSAAVFTPCQQVAGSNSGASSRRI